MHARGLRRFSGSHVGLPSRWFNPQNASTASSEHRPQWQSWELTNDVADLKRVIAEPGLNVDRCRRARRKSPAISRCRRYYGGGFAMMTRDEWQRVKDVTAAAWALPVAERDACVESACHSDAYPARSGAEAAAGDDRGGRPLRVAGTAGSGRPLHAIAAAAALGVDAVEPVIGSWQLIREIGVGGMGTVYLAERRERRIHAACGVEAARSGFPTRASPSASSKSAGFWRRSITLISRDSSTAAQPVRGVLTS